MAEEIKGKIPIVNDDQDTAESIHLPMENRVYEWAHTIEKNLKPF